MCLQGDSGGPVFIGRVALGIISTCVGFSGPDGVIYTPIDFTENNLGVVTVKKVSS